MVKKRSRKRKYTRRSLRSCDPAWSAAQRIDYYSKPDPLSGCHIWHGLLILGYGRIHFRKKVYLAHRLAWEAKHGPIPKGLVLRHRCNVKRCCNPDHLVLGTRAENNADIRAEHLRLADARAATALAMADASPDLAPIRIFVRGVEMKGNIEIKLVDPDLLTGARASRMRRRRASRAA
jgi:HNH endonuclease